MVSLLQRSLPHCLRVAFYTGWGFTRAGARVRSKQQEQPGGPPFGARQWGMFPSRCFSDVLDPAKGDDAAASEGTPSRAKEA